MSEEKVSRERRATLKLLVTGIMAGVIAGVGGYFSGTALTPPPKTIMKTVTATLTSKTITKTLKPPLVTELVTATVTAPIPKSEEEVKPEEIKTKTEEKVLFKHHRRNITFLKFVSSENGMYLLDDSEIAELKSLNVNGIRICPLYSLRKDGTIREDMPEFFFTNLIKKVHREGFAVFLDINVGGIPTETGEPVRKYDDPKHINDLYEIAFYWTKIAEKEKVEFFSPLNEPNLMFVDESLANQWIEKSQQLKSIFSGNLVLKFADIGPEKIGDISEYDYLAFDIMWSDARYQELRNHLKMAVEKGNNLKKKYDLKGFFFGELGAERSRIDKNVQAQLFKIILEETWGKVDGYCFLGWSNLEFRFRDNEEAKEIIKEWYARSP